MGSDESDGNRRKTPRGSSFLVLIALAVVVVVISRFEWPTELRFEDLDNPAGFRTLVSGDRASSSMTGQGVLVGLEAKRQSSIDASTKSICRSLFDRRVDPHIGPADAKVRIVEFFDYQCPSCRLVASVLADLQDEDDAIQVVYKEWPIFGKASELAARYALAAHQQGRYLDFHTRLMRRRVVPTPASLAATAEASGLDVAALKERQAGEPIAAAIALNGRLAKSLGFRGTPSFVIGRTLVEGAMTKGQFKRLVAEEKASRKSDPCRNLL